MYNKSGASRDNEYVHGSTAECVCEVDGLSVASLDAPSSKRAFFAAEGLSLMCDSAIPATIDKTYCRVPARRGLQHCHSTSIKASTKPGRRLVEARELDSPFFY